MKDKSTYLFEIEIILVGVQTLCGNWKAAMIKRDITQLAIYYIESEMERVHFANLRDLYLYKTSEIIYIVKDKKLYGIVGMREVLHAGEDGEVQINKNFKKLIGYNIIEAHEIFQRWSRIHKIPVINEQGELLGEYSRWDDSLYIERNCKEKIAATTIKNFLELYDEVYVVKPSWEEKAIYNQMQKQLRDAQITFTVLDKHKIGEKLLQNVICIFMSEDEKRGIQCLYKIEPRAYDDRGRDIRMQDKVVDERWIGRMTTYKNLLTQWIEAEQFERLEIDRAANSTYVEINQKATILLHELQKKGIACFCIYLDEGELTDYGRKFQERVAERLQANPLNIKEPWLHKEKGAEFYGELTLLKDYKAEIAQKETYNAAHVFEYKKGMEGKYFNAKEGRRVTCFQPKEYQGTIYFLGPCTVIGVFVEDQYTVESYLQKKLLERGYHYRVENYGAMCRLDAAIDSRLEQIGRYYNNDIVIYLSPVGKVPNIQGTSLEKIFERYCIPNEWVTDCFAHCNHKANKLIADSVLEMITPCLKKEVSGDSKKEIDINIDVIMKDFIERKYLRRYFGNWNRGGGRITGAIVMNCNPFSRGHRYLIEQARKCVEFLIVFVVEEDESLFPFEERFRLIEEGTKDMDNVMVVPSGDFILSRNNFREYFLKEEDEVVALNAEYDIGVFADYIAKSLHITYRFAGQEPEDRVTDIYNDAMRKVLPQKGISFVEFPRIEIEGEVISASRVRNALKDREYDKVWQLVPETTRQYLKKQIEFE